MWMSHLTSVCSGGSVPEGSERLPLLSRFHGNSNQLQGVGVELLIGFNS